MDSLPGMKNKVITKLATAEQNYEDQKGYDGMLAGKAARSRLNYRKQNMETAQEAKLGI